MNLRNIVAMILATASVYGHCASNVVPPPNIQRGDVVEMRVAYVINPRLPRMSDAQLKILLDAVQETTHQHFGVTLRFSPVQELSIETLFARLTPEVQQSLAGDIYDFKSGKGDPARLAQAYTKEIRQKHSAPLADQIAYVSPFFRPRVNSQRALGEAAARHHLSRIDQWKSLKALDGGSVIDDKPYNEFLMWTALGSTGLPFELVLTNQLIVSAEYVMPALHAAIRGGYTNGTTTDFNKNTWLVTTSIWSTFAFTANDDWVTQLRDGERYGAEEAARLAGSVRLTRSAISSFTSRTSSATGPA